MTFRLQPITHLTQMSEHCRTWLLAKNWRIGVTISFILSGSIGLWGLSQIIGLPALPNCWVIAFSDAPAATKLYCAEQLSNRNTPETYQQAINLAHSIATTDPLRPESDRHIQRWIKDLMRLGEATYQDGNLEGAIAIIRKIDPALRSQAKVEEQVAKWQATWAKAEAIYKDTEKKIDNQKWYEALITAKKLLFLDNRHWQTEKYNQLVTLLQSERETYDWQTSETDVKAMRRNSIDDFFKGLKQKQDREASTQLSKARDLAKSGDPENLEAAIDQAQQVMFGSANYNEAQRLIETWRSRIETQEDRPQLQRANQLATQGDADSLRQAIDTANDIGWGRALHDEASDRVEQWRDQLNDLETRTRTQQLDRLTQQNTQLAPPSSTLLNAVPVPDSPSTAATPTPSIEIIDTEVIIREGEPQRHEEHEEEEEKE